MKHKFQIDVNDIPWCNMQRNHPALYLAVCSRMCEGSEEAAKAWEASVQEAYNSTSASRIERLSALFAEMDLDVHVVTLDSPPRLKPDKRGVTP